MSFGGGDLYFLQGAVLRKKSLVEPMGFESTSRMETKELCGATWPSKVLKGKDGIS